MLKFVPVYLLFIIASACSSSVRFTSDDQKSKKSEKIKTETVSPEIVEDNNTETTAGTYSEDVILESDTGVASYYGKKFHGRKTASGEVYDMNELTAAHATYPFNTIVKITNLLNNKSVKVKINDRKPDFHGRVIDISFAAAQELDIITSGIAEVRVDVLSWGNKAD